jgi:putative transposase
MARQVRIQFPGAVCHVMARGNQGPAIFRSDLHRKRFLATLDEACGKAAGGR